MAIFIKIDGITGDMGDGSVRVDSFSWGVSQGGNLGGGGGGGGRAVFQDLHFTKPVSVASPQLFMACADGKHIKTAVLTVTRPNADGLQVAYLKFELSAVMVSSYQDGGNSFGSDLPVDEVSFNYQKIRMTYSDKLA